MRIAHIAVQRPVGVTMILVALLAVGLLSLQNVGLDLLPRMEIPLGTVIVVYPGADPQSVEEALTNPLESTLATLPGLERLRSYSLENAAVVVIEFAMDTDLDRAFQSVQSALSRVETLLPPQAYRPVLLRLDPSQLNLMTVAVFGPTDPVELTRRIDARVLPALQQVPGVGSATATGVVREEVAVEYDSERLAELGITPALLQQVLAYQNVVVPAGTLEDESTRRLVRAGRRITSIEELKEQPISLRPATEIASDLGFLALAQALPVRLADVATVERRPQPHDGLTLVNGEPAALVSLIKQSGENTVVVSRRVRAALAQLAADDELGLTFHVVYDQADLIRNSLANVAQAAAWGALLAVGVLLLFLRSLGPVAVVGAAIPLSAVAAVALLHATGTTLNLMSLGGLALAAGMLVDNAIVAIENIIRHREMGKSPRDAAAEGAGEIGTALAASTLTTLVVFLPIATVKSLIGQLFRDLAIAVSAAIFASLVVALTVVPAAASRWLGSRFGRRRTSSAQNAHGRAIRLPAAAEAAATAEETFGGERPGAAYQALYRRLLTAWLRRRWLTAAGLLITVALLFLLPGRLGTLFLPPMDGGVVQVRITLPPGMTTAGAHALVRHYDAAIRALPDVERVTAVLADRSNAESILSNPSAARGQAQFIVALKPREERRRTAAEIAAEIATIPPVAGEQVAIQPDRIAAALGDDYFPGVTVHVTGVDLERLEELAAEAASRLAAAPGFRNVRTSLSPPEPELFYRVSDRSFQGVLAGGEPLTAGQVGLALRNHLSGIVATHLLIDGVRLPVVLRPEPGEIESVAAVGSMRIPGSQLRSASGAPGTGRPILERIAVVEQVEGPRSIEHLNRARLVVIQAELDGLSLSAGKQAAMDVLSHIEVPPGYTLRIAGIHQVIESARGEMLQILCLAILFVYVVMAVLFESWSQPLLLMLAVPLALAGALGSLYLAGLPLSVPAGVGLVLLAGIAVNNGIVMIDLINQLRRQGMPLDQAVIAGCTARLRPILMTAATTLFGLLPLALARGDGSEFQIPMAIAVCGGLVYSTLLLLFLLPGMLLFFDPPARPRRAPLRALGLTAFIPLALAAWSPPASAERVDPAPASGKWQIEAAATLVTQGDTPRLALGAGLVRRSFSSETSLRLAAGAREAQPFLASVHGLLHYRFGPTAVDLTYESDQWLQPYRGHETLLSAGVRAPHWAGRAWVARANLQPGVHPWTGRVTPAWNGWQAGLWMESPLTERIYWQRSAVAYWEITRPPTWVVSAGPTYTTPIAHGSLEGGLILRQGAYRPVLRLGARLFPLFAGEVELYAAPLSGPALAGWPLFSAGYRGPAGAADVHARVDVGSRDAPYAWRVHVQLEPFEKPYALLATWSRGARWEGAVGVRLSF